MVTHCVYHRYDCSAMPSNIGHADRCRSLLPGSYGLARRIDVRSAPKMSRVFEIDTVLLQRRCPLSLVPFKFHDV